MSPTGYSQAGRDRFVLAMLSDDHPRAFVDVGCQWLAEHNGDRGRNRMGLSQTTRPRIA